MISLLLVPGKKLMKANVCEAGKTVLGREITNNEFQKVSLLSSHLSLFLCFDQSVVLV